jgi:hypothetical protein
MGMDPLNTIITSCMKTHMKMVEQRQIQSPKYDIKRQHENSRKEKKICPEYNMDSSDFN